MTSPARTPNPRGEGDAPVVAAIAPEQAQARRRRDSVGELLRQTRLSYGANIETTAASLRIRRSYLSAIEEGRYDELPGLVYALGFVRAYAVHLGLDGDEAVRRFKQESAGLERPPDLSFPLPLTKRSIPGGRMLLAALVLAVCGYGLWYYLSTGDRSRPEQVSAVPAQLLPPPPVRAPGPAAPPPTAAAAPSPSAPAAMETPAATPPAQSSTADTAPPAGPAPVPPATPVPAAAAPKPPASEPAVTAVALPPPPTAAIVASLPNAPAPPPAPPATSTVEKPPPAAAAGPATATATAIAVPPAPAAAVGAATAMAVPPAPAAATQPRVFGAVNGPTRIIVRAIGDCWLQVRDPNDALVAQRTLHKDDTYRVPEEPGLVMRTGNASALEILVDGKPVRAIGGTVRHVLLDPDRLLAGTATAE